MKRIARANQWLEEASVLTGSAEIPGKGAAVGQDFNQTMCLGNRVGPGSLSGPAHFLGLKILLSEEDKGRANHRQCDF